MTQALAIIGILVYYAAVAAAFIWVLRKNSVWFAAFLAIVASQTLLFGGTYLYYGYWDSWWSIAVITTSAMSIATSGVVAFVFSKYRAGGTTNAHT
jgi:hypothetical protein